MTWTLYNQPITPTVDDKREKRNVALSTARPYVPIEHDRYLSATAPEIVKRISSNEWTASVVLEAYIARATVAHQAINCLTEVMFDTARERALELDADFARTGKCRGLLHGVPVSLKDQFEVIGYDATVGFTQWANKPCTTNAFVVDLLISHGAIPFVKTNVPQTMMAFECTNPLWGRTLNPHSAAHTCGGSSGGEAALLGARGSPLGLGSDIAGSLRIPASYCGVYSLKPSFGRMGGRGARSPHEGFEAIMTVIGPMGRSVDDLELAARVMLGAADPLDDVMPLPFREVKLGPKLRFGYYTEDGFVRSSPANKRAVLEAIDALRREGHECVEFQLPFSKPHEALQLFNSLATSDGYKGLLSPLGPDPMEKVLLMLTLPPRFPQWLRSLLAWAIETFAKDEIFADILRSARHKPVSEFYDLTAERNALRRRFTTEVWNKHGFDGIIAPVQALPTVSHGACRDLAPLANATLIYNVLDLPAGVVPVTRVSPALDAPTPAWAAAAPRGSPLVTRAAFGGARPVYDARAMKGVPVGVQVVGRKWEEEKVLAMMRVLDGALGERGFGPSG